MELHNKNIKLLCRVCGQLLGSKHYFIGEILKVKLEKLFHVEITDLEIVHPPKMCKKCYCTINNVLSRKTSTALGLCTKWKPHCDDCFTCQSVKKLRKGLVVSKEQSRNKAICSGRQKNDSKMWTYAMFTTIKEAITIIHDEDIDISELNNELNPHLQHCLCNICGKIPKQPLTLKKCEHLFCFFCIVENIKLKPISKAICPQCQEHLLYEDLLTSNKTNSLIKMLTVACILCQIKFNIIQEYEIYKNHKDICSKKATFLPLTLPLSSLAMSPTTYLKPYSSKTNISDVFKLTKDSVIPRIVEDAALHTIKQMMAKNEENLVTFRSGGPRPVLFSSVSQAYVCSNKASIKTLRCRNILVKNQLEIIAGKSNDAVGCQSSKLLNSFQPEMRELILTNSNIKRVTIGAAEIVAMKADLSLPWEKLKTISRWLKTFDIKIASYASQRLLFESLLGDDIIVENAPFAFQKEVKGTFEIKLAPWGYIEHLPTNILRHLEKLESCNSLINHEFILQKEIQIKIGGDYGGGSFKMSYQIVNTHNPNNKDNTIVFSIFEAKDYRINIKVAIARFQKQIEDLQRMKYKDNSIRVFVFGDYQFLCALYGISGATGRHCCLFCNATSTDMKGIESQSAEIKVRTLENLYTDYKSFIENGGRLNDAKHFNNVITEPMLKIPLDQVSLPSLHMALGIYLNFFNFFEDEVHELDVLLAAEAVKMTNNYTASYSEEYQVFVKEQKELSNLQCEIVCLNEKLQSINDIALLAAIQNSDYDMNVQSLYNSDIDSINFKKGEKTNQYNTLMQKHSLKKGQGPCTRQIEAVLQKLNVQRQAYHGKSFIGNHVHKMLKKSSILELCNSIPKLVYNKGLSETDVHQTAIEISTKYKKLFHKFAQCYCIFSSKIIMTIEKLTLLKKNIEDLMQYFRATFPKASVTPKLHMLENHAVPFLKKWGAGFGYYGEQGGESVHMEFNKLKTIYQSIPSPTMQLKSILKCHHQKTNPENILLKPCVNKRKRK